MGHSALRITIILTLPVAWTAIPVSAASVSFDQLNWFGLAMALPDSSWGKVTVDYTGTPTTRYFNLDVDGRWTVQNMVLDSPFGDGISQSVSTFFDLGVSHGTDVPSLIHVFTIESAPRDTIPVGTPTADTVANLDFQIGGAGPDPLVIPDNLNRDFETGGGLVPASSHVILVRGGKLKDLDKFVNQALGVNDCVRGSVSNSLKFLQARKVIPKRINADVNRVRQVLGTVPNSGNPPTTPHIWVKTKKNHYKRVHTQSFPGSGNKTVTAVINALKRGHDVELDMRVPTNSMAGHTINVVGLRVKSVNGKRVIEIDVFDDNQKKSGADGMKTYTIFNNTVVELGMTIKLFVIESPKVVKKPNRQKKKSRDARSRSNQSISFDPETMLLSLGRDFIVDSGFIGDPIVGSEVILPPFELVEIGADEVVFDRLLVDDPVAIANGQDLYLMGEIATLTYVPSENQFHGTLFDLALSGVDPASPFFDPALSLNSPFIQDLDRVLNPNSPDFDRISELFVAVTPDTDFPTATNFFTTPVSSEFTKAIFAGQPVPEPGALFVLAGGLVILSRRRPSTGSGSRKSYRATAPGTRSPSTCSGRPATSGWSRSGLAMPDPQRRRTCARISRSRI